MKYDDRTITSVAPCVFSAGLLDLRQEIVVMEAEREQSLTDGHTVIIWEL
jgi:hypothetical protein